MIDRLSSAEDERAFLSGAFCDPTNLMLVSPRDFSVKAHEAICEAAQRAFVHSTVSEETVRIELERAGKGQHVELAKKIAEIVPDLDAMPAIASRVRELSSARDCHRYARQAVNALESGDLETARVSLDLLSASSEGRTVIESKTVGDHASDLVNSWGRATAGISPIGIPSIDAQIGGLERDGSLLVFGARTHVGKSYFALTCVDGLLTAGERPGIITVEDPARLWAARALAAETKIPAERLRRGLVNDDEKAEAARGVLRWRERGGHLVSAVGAGIDHVVAASTHLVRERGCTVLLIDYLQAIASNGKDARGETNYKLAQLKSACSRLGVPWILFSQLRRPDDLSKLWSEPEIAELKESGEIENRAEAILLGWRPGPTGRAHDWKTAPMFGAKACGRCKIDWQPAFDDEKRIPLCQPPLLVRVAKAKGMPTSGKLVVMRRGPGWLWEPAPREEEREWETQVDNERDTARASNGSSRRNGARA